ncbi:hypothetical protein HWV23_04420 [Natronomonas halophila]|uniref:DUF4200 domain-containing protein n=1 Tax=Natronomonas halophila TaxID=2747817 RepID=UPI0015B76185|nr:DUF4200 domain-containing protein [Natronomonas halophila]QLD84994.1 hypothetical protein HWV23_04420 [Natronomonas halophila]
MDAHTVIEEWEVSPFDGGFDGLRDLQSRRFSGAVEVGDSRLFLREGEPLAVVSNFEEDPREGRIDVFEDAAGRLHEASAPATASLAAMLALDGEVRGRYFSDDTPISRVHETLSGGGFTGYIELSENVLSGDYFVVYEDGDEDYIGYISASGRLITDEEAQQKAEGEIGIYDVVAVSLPDVEIPEPSEPDAGTAAAGVVSDTEPESEPESTTEPTPVADSGPEPESEPAPESDAEAQSETTASVSEPEADSEPASEPAPESESEPAAEPTGEAESDPAVEPETGPESPAEPAPTAEPTADSEAETSPTADTETDSEDDDASPGSAATPQPDDPSDAAAATEPETEPVSTQATETATDTEESTTPAADTESDGREPSGSSWNSTESQPPTSDSTSDPTGSVMDGITARSVPSIDPENTGRGQTSDGETAAGGAAAATSAAETQRTQATSEPEPEPEPESEPASEQAAAPPDAESAEETVPEDEVQDRIMEVRQEYEAELDSLRSELDALRAERDRLQERVETLEAAEESAGGAGAGASGVSLTPDRALAGTSLFVRDEGPGGPTLEDAHAGNVDADELDENLRIEYHTQFEDEGATVDGEPFDAFLTSSPRYAFAEWLLTSLLFEIQSTRSESVMRPLYDALPEIDRISFDDTVAVGEDEEGRDIEFDVVARDRMGDPLVVANMDESRDPTHADSLEPLIDDASDIGMDADRFAGAFAVTSSYFEPDALEAAREATSGSLLSREKYRNFVKLSRNKGFHLCLVESRDESFHMTMPEL